MAPVLFNLYLHCLLLAAGSQSWTGATGSRVDSSDETLMVPKGEFADDVLLLNSAPLELESQVNSLDAIASEEGMKLSHRKTKAMWVSHPFLSRGSHTPCPPLRISLGSNVLEQVTSFRYLGSIIDSSRRTSVELANRVQVARGKLFALRQILKHTSVTIGTKDRLLKQCVIPALLYAAETWVATRTDVARVQSFVNSAIRHNRNISLLDRVAPAALWASASIAPIELTVAMKRVTWAQKLSLRPDGDLAKEASKLGGLPKLRGRPLLSWGSSITADIKKLGLSRLPETMECEPLKQKIKSVGFVATFLQSRKPLECPTCGKKYKSAAWLEKHAAKHTGA